MQVLVEGRMEKLTENQVIDYLCEWLQKNGWSILDKNKGHSRGIDVKAQKDDDTLIVEAKGARGNPKSPVTTRAQFDSGQVKFHLGEAIVKVLEQKHQNPNAIVAIAQPDDPYIKNCLRNAIPEVVKCGIKLFWVKSASEVKEE